MLNWAVFDLDGTLADDRWRVSLIRPSGPERYDLYHQRGHLDSPLEPWASLARNFVLQHRHNRIAIATARPEVYRAATEEWLSRNLIPFSELQMRPFGDTRSAVVVKEEMLIFRAPRVYMIVDNDPRILDLWERRNARLHVHTKTILAT